MKKIVFVGTSTPLQKVLHKFKSVKALGKIQLMGVFTEPDPSSQVAQLAAELSTSLFDIHSLKDSKGIADLESLAPDYVFSINSTVLFSGRLLKIAKYGNLNLHPGILPEYAGLHTHQWAIRNLESEFGSTLHWMDEGIDTGDIAYQKKFGLSGRETGISLFLKCLEVGVELVMQGISDIEENRSIPRMSQDIARRKIYKHRDSLNGMIDLDWPALKIEAFFRAGNYAPFRSPTYVPQVLLNNKTYTIKSLKIGPETMLPVGTILEIVNASAHVATGNGTSVWITAESPIGE